MTGERTPPQWWFPFEGGLGDILLRCYRTRFWHHLELAEEPTGVVVASVNPFATELFRWHVNREQIVIVDLAHAYENLVRIDRGGKDLQRALYEFAGLDWPGCPPEYFQAPPAGWKPTFFAPDYLDDRGHFVFHPFAGLERRRLPDKSVAAILEVLGGLPCPVYVPSRDFLRFSAGRGVHGAERLPVAEDELPDNVVVLNNLSVPATLNLIRNARGFIGAHSSLVLAAAYEGIPSLALYPEFLAPEFDASRKYAFYAALEHMTCLPFQAVSETAVSEWLATAFDLATIENPLHEKRQTEALAKWAIARGGVVNIDWFCRPDFATAEEVKNMRKQKIQHADSLPRGRFRIWRLSFAGCGDFDDRDLDELQALGRGITSVTNLNLADTSVTPAGLDKLDWLSASLQSLDPGPGASTPDDLARIAAMMPGCKVVGG